MKLFASGEFQNIREAESMACFEVASLYSPLVKAENHKDFSQ
jgi:hypothetical protein